TVYSNTTSREESQLGLRCMVLAERCCVVLDIEGTAALRIAASECDRRSSAAVPDALSVSTTMATVRTQAAILLVQAAKADEWPGGASSTTTSCRLPDSDTASDRASRRPSSM